MNINRWMDTTVQTEKRVYGTMARKHHYAIQITQKAPWQPSQDSRDLFADRENKHRGYLATITALQHTGRMTDVLKEQDRPQREGLRDRLRSQREAFKTATIAVKKSRKRILPDSSNGK